MRYKYRTIAEYMKETNNTKLGKILVLSEHDIDILVKHGVFTVDDRQVWYGSDTKVFPITPVELPEGANLIEINAVDIKDFKHFD